MTIKMLSRQQVKSHGLALATVFTISLSSVWACDSLLRVKFDYSDTLAELESKTDSFVL